jgi:hypothetical protein
MKQDTRMNPTFQRLMAEATRLTRAGSLRAATDAIRRALGSGPASAGQPIAPLFEAGDVIDMPARELPPDTAAPTPAVAPTPPGGQFIAGSHSEANGSRAYKLYLPPGHATQPLPLVVMLHGCTQDPDDFAVGTGMNDAALERGFYVLYPAQDQHANASRCWNWFKHTGAATAPSPRCWPA